MKIIKNKKLLLILILVYSITSFFMIIKEKKIYKFTDENKITEYILEKTFRENYKLIFLEYEFENLEKIGENNSYFAFFFLSFEDEKEEENYYILDKKTNKFSYSSSKDIIIEKGIILKNVETFMQEKGVTIYD
ncbi:hypothetical protein [Fusobacterium pseudoperiodonticum]|uniref:DUF3139 domain-containing protein n=1 Tax=Fusobacterium pseudoperiodonticum TaxID=2663009 RepID=A0A2G9EFR3_9FUSO|nr:hypothetical protein [Fusobacterium pseudoperiodonticum]PIM79705.1 hypothetical protein CTM71_04520 [Fusobacterium pseudoperiodonticum]